MKIILKSLVSATFKEFCLVTISPFHAHKGFRSLFLSGCHQPVHAAIRGVDRIVL